MSFSNENSQIKFIVHSSEFRVAKKVFVFYFEL
jgi:hypothetical protein